MSKRKLSVFQGTLFQFLEKCIDNSEGDTVNINQLGTEKGIYLEFNGTGFAYLLKPGEKELYDTIIDKIKAKKIIH